MSAIEEVRVAGKRVEKVLKELKRIGVPRSQRTLRRNDELCEELRNATDEYARAVRELTSK
jgi:hypothetical protein